LFGDGLAVAIDKVQIAVVRALRLRRETADVYFAHSQMIARIQVESVPIRPTLPKPGPPGPHGAGEQATSLARFDGASAVGLPSRSSTESAVTAWLPDALPKARNCTGTCVPASTPEFGAMTSK
jgi:hypothetical protein